jgi:hypothetical protein
MISDLALARLAFAHSPTSVEAQLEVARLRLEVEAARHLAATRAEARGLTAPEVEVSIATRPVDKRA